MARSRNSKRSLLGFLAAAILALSVQGGLAAPAQADNCWQADSIRVYCNYAGEAVGSGVGRWFSAPGGNNLRQWYWNETADAYGGTVHKCVGVKGQYWLNPSEWCGWGSFGVDINNVYPASWIFVRNLANGPRIIYGQGRHWIPNA
jgi:hypothetical protein